MYYYLVNYWPMILMTAIIIVAAVICCVAIIKRNNNPEDEGDYYDDEDEEDNDDDDDGDYDEDEEDDDDGDYYEEVDTEPSGTIIVMEWEAEKDPDADSSALSAAILGGARYIVANIDDDDIMGWMSVYAARLRTELSNETKKRGYRISSIHSYAMSLEDYFQKELES